MSFEALLNIVVTSTLDTFLKGSWMPSSIDQNSISQFLIALANTIFKKKELMRSQNCILKCCQLVLQKKY